MPGVSFTVLLQLVFPPLRCQLCVFPDVTWTDLERRFFWSIIIYLIYTIIDISSGCRHQDKQKYTITMWKPRLADVFRCKIAAPFAWVTFIIYVIPTQIFQIQGKKLNVNSSIGNTQFKPLTGTPRIPLMMAIQVYCWQNTCTWAITELNCCRSIH